MIYPVGDLVIRIKNAYSAGLESLETPHSKMRVSVLAALKEMRYIKDYTVTGETKKTITIKLTYDEAGAPAVTGVKIISRPGRRWYTKYADLKPVLGGLGRSVVSTSKGVMDAKKAKKSALGGELLFNIW